MGDGPGHEGVAHIWWFHPHEGSEKILFLSLNRKNVPVQPPQLHLRSYTTWHYMILGCPFRLHHTSRHCRCLEILKLVLKFFPHYNLPIPTLWFPLACSARIRDTISALSSPALSQIIVGSCISARANASTAKLILPSTFNDSLNTALAIKVSAAPAPGIVRASLTWTVKTHSASWIERSASSKICWVEPRKTTEQASPERTNHFWVQNLIKCQFLSSKSDQESIFEHDNTRSIS